MDVYSFSLLCFWLLFQTSNPFPLAPWIQCEYEECISFEGNKEQLDALECLKNNENDNLLRWITWLIDRQDNFEDDERKNLHHFFRCTLAYNPDQRSMNYNDLLCSLAPHRAIRPPAQIQTDLQIAEEQFEIRSSYLEFYQTDFRLRTYITTNLLSIVSESPKSLTRHISPQKATFQLALCYRIGFGVPRDVNTAHKFLEKSLQSLEDLDHEISTLQSAAYKSTHISTFYMRMENQSSEPWQTLPQYYRERNILENAECNYLREIRDIHEEFGDSHNLNATLKHGLAMIYINTGDWIKAEELQVQVIEMISRELGPEHTTTLSTKSNLALMYWYQGNWAKAEELQKHVTKIFTESFGPEHPKTACSKANLAVTFLRQGRLVEAEQLHEQAIEIQKRVLGPENPATLTSMGNLASVFREQKHLDKAENLEKLVTEIRTRVLGVEHPDTLASMTNLALTYRDQGRWAEAEELQIEVVEKRQKLYGPEHHYTLNSIENLASTYSTQLQWAKAKELQVEAVVKLLKLLGPEHPDTLTIMDHLASTH